MTSLNLTTETPTMALRDDLQRSLGAAYTLERELGGGGMSRVFVADELALGRKVVVKVLPPDAGVHLSAERFRREISVAAQLQHPHIVPLLAAGDANGTPYFTMPYIRGESLRARLSASGALPVNDAVRILRQLASALAFAHEAGVVHRDIKPDNVLISGDAAMVTDFGVAKAVSASTTAGDSGLTSLGVALGTPAYMSPEQASADPHVDHRADIYAWGILAYEMLTGDTPFAGRPPQAMLAAHTTESPQPVALRRQNLPPQLAALVMRCLEKRPADRPQRAQDLVHELDAIGTPGTGMQPATAIARQRRTLAFIGVAVVTVIVIAFLANRGLTGSGVSSVAVLPFEVVGGDTSTEYLAEGLADGLSSDLLRRGVRVAPRATTNLLRAKGRDLSEIASDLKVGSVFIAKVRLQGKTLHVVYDLVSSDGATLAQASFPASVSDPQALKDVILEDLLRRLIHRPERGGASTRKPGREVSPVVYDLYLRALHVRNTFSKAGIEKAIELFRQAIALDSTYAPLWADMGWSYMQLADGYYPPRLVVPQAEQAVRKALALDDSSAQAHANLAALYQQYLFQWDSVRVEADRALALNPDLAEGYLWRAGYHLTYGDRTEALRAAQRSIELDPMSSFVNFAAVWTYSFTGMPDSAISRYHRLQEIEPGFFYLEVFVDDAYRKKGMLDSALALNEWGSKLAERPLGGQIITLVQMGRRDEARRLFSQLERHAAKQYVPPEILARAALALGDSEKAITYLERGADAQSALVSMVAWYPEFRTLVGHPRFERYLSRVNLTERIHRQVR